MRYAIGDIHGCIKSLRKLVEEIIQLNKSDDIYFVGDFIDRGPAGKKVVDYVMNLSNQGYRIHSVKGNHEEMLVNALFYKTPEKYSLWLYNGADTTLASYGADSSNFDWESAINLIPDDHLMFYRDIPYYIRLDDYIVVHAGINFRTKEPFKDTRSMVWCRDCDNDLSLSGGRVIVHGHTPISLEIIEQNLQSSNYLQINIDAGCVYKGQAGLGNLAAIDLDGLKLYHTPNIDF